MAGAFAVMMKRRYDHIVAKQEEREKRERRKRLKKPPTSSENTLVWHWDLDGRYCTVMYDKHKREVWCNGLVLLTESILPEVTGDQCSIGFLIDMRPECTQCGSSHCSRVCQTTDIHTEPCQDRDLDNSNNHQSSATQNLNNQQSPLTSSTNGISNTSGSSTSHVCDCVQCNSQLHKGLIKFIRVEVDKTASELYVDGCMIQEHTENCDEFTNPKPQTLKKND